MEQDDARALELYTASAQQDFPYAAYELGKMYRDGIGCEKDAEASEQWYRQAFAGFLELEQQSHDDKLQYRIGWMLLHEMCIRDRAGADGALPEADPE